MMKTLLRPIDNAILVYFRFFAGILLSYELLNDLLFQGAFYEYTSPPFHFSYLYFDWIKPWPAWGMMLHFIVTVAAGIGVAVNFRYRLSSVILFLGYTSLFLMEKSEYINHIYLYCLVSFWLMLLPLDKKRGEAPAWILYLLLFHISVVYFFAGVAKLNPDWLSGNAMRHFLERRGMRDPYLPIILAWCGALFDLGIVPLLLWKKTRDFAFMLATLFHLSNALIFGLATFPWFALMMTAMFFDPSWPRRWWKKFEAFHPEATFSSPPLAPLTLYCLLHVLIPLRQHLYPGNTSWTEEGHMFSWRMKLRSKSGHVHYKVKDKKTSQELIIFPQSYLTPKQYRTLIGRPDHILQFAHFLKEDLKKKMGWDAEVYASSQVSINGTPLQEMIKADVDLTQKERTIAPYDWIQLK